MITHVRVLSLLVLAAAALLGADHRITAAGVVQLVFTSLCSDHDDSRLADDLHRLRMVEQLNPHVVLYFRNVGVGPLALRQLERLRDQSVSLATPLNPPLAVQPVPPDEEQSALLSKIEKYAQSYVRGLPNFLCDQVTQRYSNVTVDLGDGEPRFSNSLHFADSFSRSLRFVNGIEERTDSHHSRKKDVDLFARRGQSISQGEFGMDMAIILGTGVDPQISWDHWEMFDGKWTAVLKYYVGLPKSRYTLSACCTVAPGGGEMRQAVTASIRGLLYADPVSGVISRITIQPLSLPQSFLVKESETIIDYADVRIGTGSYRLPVRAVSYLCGRIEKISGSQRNLPFQRNRNEISFINYRKFEAASSLTFANSKISYGDAVPK
jgi:hypothetical protein